MSCSVLCPRSQIVHCSTEPSAKAVHARKVRGPCGAKLAVGTDVRGWSHTQADIDYNPNKAVFV